MGGGETEVVACFWEVEEHLADIFGLNDSKYQFAIDEYMQRSKRRRIARSTRRGRGAGERKRALAAEADALEGGGDGLRRCAHAEAGKEEREGRGFAQHRF